MSIVDNNVFNIDSYYNNTGDRSYYNNHYYSDKAPGQSFLSSPIYYIWKLFFSFTGESPDTGENYFINKIIKNPITGEETKTYEIINPGNFFLFSLILVTVFTCSLSTALTVVLIYKISKFLTKKESYRVLLTITYGLGTLAFMYGTIYFTHAPSTLFSFLSFYIIYTLKQKKKFDIKLFFLSGIFSGFGVVVDYNILLISMGCILFVFLSKNLKRLIIFLLGFLLGITPLLLYNYSILGTPFQLIYAYTDPDIRTDIDQNMGFSTLINPYIIFRHTFGTYRGLFFFHPILLLSIVGLYYMVKKEKKEAFLISLIFISFLAILSGRVTIWDFGSCFGGRYYLPVIPLLMLPLMYSFKKMNIDIIKTFLIISIFFNIIGLQNWEWMTGDRYSVQVSPYYQSRVNSFEILANPLKDHYLPLFIRNGPRARIVENLISEKPIDIRHISSSTSEHPFITLIPLLVLLSLVWIKEIRTFNFLQFFKENTEIVFIPFIIVLLLA